MTQKSIKNKFGIAEWQNKYKIKSESLSWSAKLNVRTHIVCIQYIIMVMLCLPCIKMYQTVGIGNFVTASHHYYYFLHCTYPDTYKARCISIWLSCMNTSHRNHLHFCRHNLQIHCRPWLPWVASSKQWQWQWSLFMVSSRDKRARRATWYYTVFTLFIIIHYSFYKKIQTILALVQ